MTHRPYRLAPTGATSLHLVACVAGKADQPMPARQLYRSDWFSKARRYCESWSLPYMILSAEHGLLSPDQVVAPYDRTLLSMTRADRLAWADTVRSQIEVLQPSSLVLLAGAAYREPFKGWQACPVSAPLAGLGIGDQKHWLLANALPAG